MWDTCDGRFSEVLVASSADAVGQRIPAELMSEFFGRLDRAMSCESEVVPLAA